MTVYGYARVSTDGQTLDAQVSALKAAGAEKVYSEKQSGAKTDRAALARVLAALESGDALVVTRLDRLARSTRDFRIRRGARPIRMLIETGSRLCHLGRPDGFLSARASRARHAAWSESHAAMGTSDSAFRRPQDPWYKGQAPKTKRVSAIHSIQPIALAVTISRRIPR
jgi:hypothetical protein